MSRFTRWSKKFVPGDVVLTQYQFHGKRRTGIVDYTNGPNLMYVRLRYAHKGEDVDYIAEIYPAELELVE